MALLGSWDKTGTPLGWFDVAALAPGWFDETAMPADAGSPTSWTITPTGNIVFSGTSLEIRSRVLVVSGTLTFSGLVALIKTRISSASGTVVFSGTAALQFTPGVVVAQGTNLPLTGVGH